MKFKIVFVVVGLFLLLAALASAATPFSAAVAKSVFGKGEDVSVSVAIKNEASAPRAFVVEVNVVGGGLAPAPVRMPLSLAANEEKTVSLSPLVVDDGTPPGEYEARVRLLEGDGSTLLETKTVAFAVRGTLNRISDFSVSVCADAACAQRASVYYKGNTVFLKYACAEEGLTANAVVKAPSGEKTVALPASLVVDASGNYVVTATASKEGFKPAVARAEFSVLEKPVTLVEERGLTGETLGKPREKGEAGVEGEGGRQADYALIGVALVAIVLLAVVFTWLRSRKKPRKRV